MKETDSLFRAMYSVSRILTALYRVSKQVLDRNGTGSKKMCQNLYKRRNFFETLFFSFHPKVALTPYILMYIVICTYVLNIFTALEYLLHWKFL